MGDVVQGKWSSESAFNLLLALQESQVWIEAVVGQKFPHSDFQKSLKNGVFLCQLINQIKPGSVPKINPSQNDFSQRENLQAFIQAGKKLGLRDAQIFDTTDLFEAKRIRNVAICLYWLGRAARMIPTYKGPQLNLLAFKKMNCTGCKKPIENNNYLATLDQQWHIQCAHCCSCDAALNPKEKFFQHADKIYCPRCMESLSTTDLTKSPGPGGKKGGQAKGDGHEHCGGCHKDVTGLDHVPDGNKKFCLDCICDLCHNPLLGPFSVKNGKKVCGDCSCFECGVPLDKGFYEEGNLRFCEPCSNKKDAYAPKHEGEIVDLAMKKPHVHGKDCDHGHGHDDLKMKKPHDHGHGHGHGPHHDHGHDNKDLKMKKKECKACDKPIDGKPHKAGDRDKFCAPHEKERICDHCDLEIVGPATAQQDKKYHPDCFKNLKGKGPCAGCKKPVVDKSVNQLGKVWHPDCFHCAKCDSDFPDGKYVEGDDGKPYCPGCDDATDLAWGPKDRCGGCEKPLSGQVTNVLNKFWHEGCFKCQRCSVKFTTGYHDFQGKPYCKPCHQELSGATKCQQCSKVLEGECYKAIGFEWHKGCLACQFCKKTIGGKDEVFCRLQQPICKNCHAQNKIICVKCRTPVLGAYAEVDGKHYCEAHKPMKETYLYGKDKTIGFTVDPRSGKKTWHA